MSRNGHWNCRPACQEDWPEVRELLAVGNLPLDGAKDHLANFVVAESDGKLVGCAGLELYGNAALLRSCAVDAAHRGEGVGRELIQQAIRRAISCDARELILLTTTAEDYFSRLGFQRIARDQITEAVKASQEFQGACPASARAMRLTIDGDGNRL